MTSPETKDRPRLQLIVSDRAETVLRYLDDATRQRVLERIGILPHHSREKVQKQYPRLDLKPGQSPMYLMRVSPTMRVIFSYPDDATVIVEDLASTNVLEKFFRRVES